MNLTYTILKGGADRLEERITKLEKELNFIKTHYSIMKPEEFKQKLIGHEDTSKKKFCTHKNKTFINETEPFDLRNGAPIVNKKYKCNDCGQEVWDYFKDC